jgi:hypothetical protein
MLGVTATLEWLLNRALLPLWAAFAPSSATAQPLAGLSRYTLNLAAVLGLMVTVSLLLRASDPNQGGAASRPLGRLSALLMGTLLCTLSTLLLLSPELLGQVIELRRAQWLLQLSAVCLASVTAVGLLAQPGQQTRLGHKLSTLLLLLPPLLLLETQWGLFTRVHALQRYGLLTQLYGPVLAVTALGLGAVGLTELPAGRRPLLAALLTCVVTTLMSVLLSRLPNLTTRMIYMSFDLRLPPHAEAYVLYLLSLSAWIFALGALGLGGTAQRVRGLGLLLIGLGGCQSRTLHQLLYYLCGLFCVAESLLPGLYRAAPLDRRRDHAQANPSIPSSAP